MSCSFLTLQKSRSCGRRWRLFYSASLPLSLLSCSIYGSCAKPRCIRNGVSAARLQRTAIVDFRTNSDAETGQRGYLLTGNPAYLKPYLEARQNSEAQLAGFMSIMNGDPLQKADTSKLAPIITAKLVELQQTIDLANANKRDEALARVKTNFGQALMAQARQLFSMMLQRSEERVDAAVRDEQQSISTLRMVTICGAIFIVMSSAARRGS